MNKTEENLIEPTESNVRYWTQRIIDVLEGGDRPVYSDFEKVIRELITADTHYAASLSTTPPASDATAPQHMPSVEELDKVYHNGNVISTLFIHHKEGLARVREACLKAMPQLCTCHKIGGTGHAQECPMCPVCQLESQLTPLRAEVEGLKRKLSEATDIMQRALDGAKELRLSAATWEKRYDEQTATAAKALEQRDTAMAQLAKRQWVSVSERMPEREPASIIFFVTPTGYGFCPSRFFGIDPRNGSTATQWFALPPIHPDDLAPAPASPPKVEMPKIKTRFIHPPIPIRSFDWEATRDGYDKGDPIGFGLTEELAIKDLEAQEEA